MPSLGWQELTIVLVIVIIIFGAGKLPEIGSALGKSIKEFKAESSDEANADKLKAGTTDTKIVNEAKIVETREVRPDEI